MGVDSLKNRGDHGKFMGKHGVLLVIRNGTRTRNEVLGLQGFEYEYKYRVAEYEISKQ